MGETYDGHLVIVLAKDAAVRDAAQQRDGLERKRGDHIAVKPARRANKIDENPRSEASESRHLRRTIETYMEFIMVKMEIIATAFTRVPLIRIVCISFFALFKSSSIFSDFFTDFLVTPVAAAPRVSSEIMRSYFVLLQYSFFLFGQSSTLASYILRCDKLRHNSPLHNQ